VDTVFFVICDRSVGTGHCFWDLLEICGLCVLWESKEVSAAELTLCVDCGVICRLIEIRCTDRVFYLMWTLIIFMILILELIA